MKPFPQFCRKTSSIFVKFRECRNGSYFWTISMLLKDRLCSFRIKSRMFHPPSSRSESAAAEAGALSSTQIYLDSGLVFVLRHWPTIRHIERCEYSFHNPN